jgi:hypothetical protein
VTFSRLSASIPLALGLILVLGCAGPAEMDKPDSTVKGVEPDASMNGALKAGSRSFEQFCSDWLSKLRSRQQTNERSLRFKRTGGLYVGEFTGYGRTPLQCKATPTGKPVTPLVGRLGYHEIRYQKSGKTRGQAEKSKARELYRIEVTELFRYNGKTWVY